MPRFVFPLSFFLLITPSVFAAKDRTVCTATINSSDEKEIFQKNLNGQGFKFVELTDFAKASEIGGSSGDWFKKACESGVKCDVLIISGHFGGSFFGENDKSLTLSSNELEEQSCKKACDGIMKNPKEVFLFGCNTLAGKSNDSRTPEQYLQVLLRDGIDRAEAERIVQARYGALGSSYKDRMRRIFSDTQVIHGFDSIGPSGKTVRSFLENFFKKSGPYNQRVQNLEGEKIVNLIDKANSKLSEINAPMAQAMKGTAYTYCSGIGEDDKLRAVKELICSLQDPSMPRSQKINNVEKMLLSPDALIYVPSLASYLKQDEAASFSLGERFKNNNKVKAVFEKIYKEYESNSPTVSMEILQLRLQLGFISKDQYSAELGRFTNKRLSRLDRENVDILCSLSNEGVDFNSINLDKIPSSAKSSPYLVFAARCLGTKDQRVTKAAMQNLSKLAGDDKAAAVFSLANMPGYDAEKLAMAKLSQNSNNKLERVASNALILNTSNDTQEQIKSVEVLIDSGYGVMATDDVVKRNIKSDRVSNKIINTYKNKVIPQNELALAVAITPNSSKNWNEILKSVDSDDLNYYLLEPTLNKKERNDYVVDWSISKIEKSDESNNVYRYSRYLSSVKLSKSEQQRLFKELKKDSEASVYIRGILKSQKASYTSEEKNLLKGYSAINVCVDEVKGNRKSTICQDHEVD